MLSEKTILELAEILEQEYEQKLSFAEVSEIAHTLTGFFDLLAKTRHRENEVKLM